MITVTVKKQKFSRALSAMLVAAADSAERPNISNVQFWQRGDRFNMASTTGHFAAWFSDVVGDEADTDRVIIARADAEFLAGVLALDKPLDPETADDEEIELEIGNGISIDCGRWSANLPHIAVDAPDLEVLVKTTARGQLPCVTLSPEILADVRKCFKKCGALKAEDESLEFGFGPTSLHPILITCEKVNELACIVMPKVPRDVDVKDDERTRRYVRRDTGEVIYEEPVSKQTSIAGTEPDPMQQSIDALQAAADAIGEELQVHTGTGTATIKPRKRAKKETANA